MATMKKFICLLFLMISSYTYAAMPDNFCGLRPGMTKEEVKFVMSQRNLTEKNKSGSSPETSQYEGENIELYGIHFDYIKVIYDSNNRVDGLIFNLFISHEEGTQRRIFSALYNEIKPGAKSVRDEKIRFNYLFKFKEREQIQYIRLSIKEVLQGNTGYNIVLTCSPTDKRLNTN